MNSRRQHGSPAAKRQLDEFELPPPCSTGGDGSWRSTSPRRLWWALPVYVGALVAGSLSLFDALIGVRLRNRPRFEWTTRAFAGDDLGDAPAHLRLLLPAILLAFTPAETLPAGAADELAQVEATARIPVSLLRGHPSAALGRADEWLVDVGAPPDRADVRRRSPPAD